MIPPPPILMQSDDECGRISVAQTDFRLCICDNRPACSYMEYVCGCGDRRRRAPSREEISILLSNGVKPEIWSVPKEVIEPRPSGPTLTLDDLIDLHFMLEELT